MHVTITGIVLALGAIQATTGSPILVRPPPGAGSVSESLPTPAQVSGPALWTFEPGPVVSPIIDDKMGSPTASPSYADAILDPTEIFPEPPAGSAKKLKARKCRDDDTWCLVGQSFCRVGTFFTKNECF